MGVQGVLLGGKVSEKGEKLQSLRGKLRQAETRDGKKSFLTTSTHRACEPLASVQCNC